MSVQHPHKLQKPNGQGNQLTKCSKLIKTTTRNELLYYKYSGSSH